MSKIQTAVESLSEDKGLKAVSFEDLRLVTGGSEMCGGGCHVFAFFTHMKIAPKQEVEKPKEVKSTIC